MREPVTVMRSAFAPGSGFASAAGATTAGAAGGAGGAGTSGVAGASAEDGGVGSVCSWAWTSKLAAVRTASNEMLTGPIRNGFMIFRLTGLILST
ncbi:MAG: hypothetical protein EOP07_10460 [Proteobacteria bacterium]|nr:MAG: hypothetical protein EOP07_10460 [Pseudomonadota bacterium]